MPKQIVAHLPAIRIPDLDRVPAARSQTVPVRTPSYRVHTVGVLDQSARHLPARRVPDFDRMVRARGGQASPVRTPRHRVHVAGMLAESEQITVKQRPQVVPFPSTLIAAPLF